MPCEVRIDSDAKTVVLNIPRVPLFRDIIMRGIRTWVLTHSLCVSVVYTILMHFRILKVSSLHHQLHEDEPGLKRAIHVDGLDRLRVRLTKKYEK